MNFKRCIIVLFFSVLLFSCNIGKEENEPIINDYKLVYSAKEAENSNNYNIFISTINGSHSQALTNNNFSNVNPRWSPDGEKIVFSSNRDSDGDYEICVMNKDGKKLARLTDNSFDDSNPSWSPDGSKILFVSDRDGDYEIYTMDDTGNNVTAITDNTYDDRDPSWSEDGEKIVFTSNQDWGNWQSDIYLMDIDGTNAQRLTALQTYFKQPQIINQRIFLYIVLVNIFIL